MDFYDSRYFKINKRMLKMLGLWPSQSSTAKFIIKSLFFIFLGSFFVPQVICIKTYIGVNPDRLIQGIGTIVYLFAIFLKFLSATLAEKKLQTVYENIVGNWKLLKTQNERNTLSEYSEFGRHLTIGYIFFIFFCLTVFITVPVIPIAVDYAFPINGTRIRIFILEGEYGVDRMENYGKIYLFESFTSIITSLVFMALDTIYAVCVEQCAGLMAVVKLRLELGTNGSSDLDDNTRKDNDVNYRAMVECVKLHKNALHFVDILESSYSTNFLLILMSNVLILSTASVVVLMNLHRPMEMVRYFFIIAGLYLHMFYISYPGEQLISISGQLHENAYTNEWYQCSIKTQKLLGIVMLKVKQPSQLTAGGLYVMSLANFGMLAKSSISYITVFASFRQ